jgi:hypothetical protein
MQRVLDGQNWRIIAGPVTSSHVGNAFSTPDGQQEIHGIINILAIPIQGRCNDFPPGLSRLVNQAMKQAV